MPTSAAAGCLLAHSHRLKGGMLRKGLVLTDAHVARLLDAGLSEVLVAELEPGDVPEDEAATRLAAVAPGAHVEIASARTGRVNAFATAPGLLVVDAAGVDAVNAVDEGLTLATLPQHALVQAGELVGTVKIIPFAVPGASLEAAVAAAHAARPLLRVAPVVKARAGMVLSTSPGLPTRLLDHGERTQRERLATLGVQLDQVVRVPHEEAAVSQALQAQLDAGLDPVLFLGASAIIDRQDVLPRALQAAGGTVDHLGMPVDPGNLLLLGHRGDATVIGLPGCARSLKPSGFDAVLRQVVTGLKPTGDTLRRMGVGGLLKEIPTRGVARRGPPAKPRRVAALVLAAGRSSRMGEHNKLLVDLDGEPLLTRALDVLGASAASPVIVVTGHMADEVGVVARARGATVVHNPDFAAGMSTSIRAGLSALPPDVDGFLLALGDMPFVRPQDVEALLEAFDPDGGAPICVPVHDKKRGHPVVWSRRFVPALMGLSGDVGARSVLAAHADEVHLVAVPDPGIHVDVDTPEALADARAGRQYAAVATPDPRETTP